MKIIPAIDLRAGAVVRLLRGQAAEVKVYPESPLEVARRYRDSGATRLHVVDLDGAFEGAPRNLAVIEGILGLGMEVQVGGGLRDMEKVDRIMQAGASWVVVGTRALTDPEFLETLIAKHGEKVIVGLDALDGKVRTDGWTKGVGEDYLAAGRRLQKAGVKHLLYTCISRDGTMTGPDVLGTVDLARSARLPVIASGGVSSLQDLTQLGAVASQGVEGVVIGKALLEGRFTVAEALARFRGED